MIAHLKGREIMLSYPGFPKNSIEKYMCNLARREHSVINRVWAFNQTPSWLDAAISMVIA